MAAVLDSIIEHSAGISVQAHAEGMRLLLGISGTTKQALDTVTVKDVGTSDDPATIAALQVASRSPAQGAITEYLKHPA